MSSARVQSRADEWLFRYGGCDFQCSVEPTASGAYRHRVRYQTGSLGIEPLVLPQDTDPYDSAAEARRHAEQQAVRCVHDRSGDGQGRF